VELWKRVTVGPDVFEALASEERISILKLLDQNKQMTGTDVANVLSISKSSAFKQLNRLARAGLVERMDEGRKWIYYRNTSKAERLLHPEDVTITLVLSSAVAAIVVGLLLLLAMHPILGPGAAGTSPQGGADPNVLILGHPTASGSDLVVQVYAGSAQLFDISVLVAHDSGGGVVASSQPSASPMVMGHSSAAQQGAGPAVTVNDLNGNGKLDAGDAISVRGVQSGAGLTLWIASNAGQMLASQSLGL
jgi:DNA-binding transcriptional ArsR family regulator